MFIRALHHVLLKGTRVAKLRAEDLQDDAADCVGFRGEGQKRKGCAAEAVRAQPCRIRHASAHAPIATAMSWRQK